MSYLRSLVASYPVIELQKPLRATAGDLRGSVDFRGQSAEVAVYHVGFTGGKQTRRQS